MILIFSFFAGVLSVLAPCVLPVLPVMLGGIAKNNEKSPYIILISSLFFIFTFTFVLKVSTYFLPIEPHIREWISALIIWFYWLFLLFPQLREQLKLLFPKRKIFLIKKEKSWLFSDILLGASLGPIFASCSPTYALIIGTILPQNITMGTLSILAYILGFGIMLALIVFFGKETAKKLSRYANPEGFFKKTIGGILILSSILLATGVFKYFETQLVNSSFVMQVTKREKNALQHFKN